MKARSRYRDTSLERRRAAAASVERDLRELRSILGAGQAGIQVVDGSAVAVELYLADTNTLCTAVRVAIFVAPDLRRGVERTLARSGFHAAEPSGDASLLRLAGRRGRRPVHVLFEDGSGMVSRGTGTRTPSRQPASADAVRERSLRLLTAWLDPASTFRRDRHDAADTHDIVESFEVQLIERSASTPPGPRSNGSRAR